MKLSKLAMAVICISYFLSSPVMAEEKLSNIWLYYSEDEVDTKDTSLLLNFGISPDDSISMSFGETKSKQPIPNTGLTRIITTNEFSLGYHTLQFAPWSMSYYYEFWGKENEIEIDSFLINMDYFFTNWVAGFNLEYRKIDAYSQIQGHNSIKSYRLGLNLEKSWQEVRWSILGDWYDYDKDLSNITTLELIRLVGLRNYTHTGVLVDWSAGTSLRYQFDDISASLKYSHSVSAVSDADSDTYALVLDAEWSDLMLNFEWGRSFLNSPFQDSETDYAVVGLGVKF